LPTKVVTLLAASEVLRRAPLTVMGLPETMLLASLVTHGGDNLGKVRLGDLDERGAISS